MSGTVTVDGAGSNWNTNGRLFVDGILNIQNGGTVDVASSFTVRSLGEVNLLNSTLNRSALNNGGVFNILSGGTAVISDFANNGILHIDGGSLVVDQITGLAGETILDTGSLTVTTSNVTIGSGGIGNQLTLGDTTGTGSFSMVVGQDTIVNSGASFTLRNNSSLATSILVNDGSVNGNGVINASVSGSLNSSFSASGGTLELGDATSFSGFRTLGSIDVGSDVITLKSRQFAQLGYQTNLNGGTLNAENGVSLGGAKAITGHGNVNASIAAQIGSTISASGNLALGDINKFDGFYSQGNLETNNNIVTINDRNEAVLGSLTTLGNSTGAGTLQSTNGLLLQDGNNLIGHGTVNGDFINKGYIEETGALTTDVIEFTGHVSGDGDFAGNILFSGAFGPGNSPAQVSFENIAFELTVS